MGDHMEQLSQYFARNVLKGGGKLVGVLGGKHQLIADGALSECHHVVHVLGGGHPCLFPLFVVPQIGPKRIPQKNRYFQIKKFFLRKNRLFLNSRPDFRDAETILGLFDVPSVTKKFDSCLTVVTAVKIKIQCDTSNRTEIVSAIRKSM